MIFNNVEMKCPPFADIAPNAYLYYYAHLSERLRRDVYLPILKALQTHQERCELPLVSVRDVERVIECLVLDVALISFFSDYSLETFNGLVFAIEFKYFLNKEKQDEVNAKMIERASKIASCAQTAGGDQIDQVRVVHRYFVTHVKYDYDYNDLAFTASGPLVRGSAACLGISLGFKMILDKLSIPAICVSGVHEGESHAWSMVYVGGGWRGFDLTYDVCRTVGDRICCEGFGSLPSEEKYKVPKKFSLPAIEKGEI